MIRIRTNWTFLKHTLLEKQALSLIIDNSDVAEVTPETEDDNKTEETV